MSFLRRRAKDPRPPEKPAAPEPAAKPLDRDLERPLESLICALRTWGRFEIRVTPPEPEQLTEERAQPFIGEYSFGPAADERFIVEMTKMGLAISRSGFPSRRMTLNGGSEFHPVGARSVLLRFTLESGRATSVSVHGMGEVVVARRVGV